MSKQLRRLFDETSVGIRNRIRIDTQSTCGFAKRLLVGIFHRPTNPRPCRLHLTLIDIFFDKLADHRIDKLAKLTFRFSTSQPFVRALEKQERWIRCFQRPTGHHKASAVKFKGQVWQRKSSPPRQDAMRNISASKYLPPIGGNPFRQMHSREHDLFTVLVGV